jgi:hypothetical protein
MYKVIISTICDSKKSITVILSKAQYNRFANNQNIGGFQRYALDIYSDDEPKQKSNIIEALQFVSLYVFYCTFKEIQSFI